MIIKIRETARHKKHRARTITAAVSRIIDTSLINEAVIVDKMINKRGQRIANNSIRVLTARLCRDQGIEYATETGDNGEFVFYRFT